MEKTLYSYSEIISLRDYLDGVSGAEEFNRYIDTDFNTYLHEHLTQNKATLSGEDIPRILRSIAYRYSGPTFGHNNLPEWRYEPIYAILRPLYEVPFNDIPLNISYIEYAVQGYVYRWRLEVVGK